jgi:hypothetical protein
MKNDEVMDYILNDMIQFALDDLYDVPKDGVHLKTKVSSINTSLIEEAMQFLHHDYQSNVVIKIFKSRFELLKFKLLSFAPMSFRELKQALFCKTFVNETYAHYLYFFNFHHDLKKMNPEERDLLYILFSYMNARLIYRLDQNEKKWTKNETTYKKLYQDALKFALRHFHKFVEYKQMKK